MLVTIPFRGYFKNRMVTGKKIATSRTRKYGKQGDRFRVFGVEFEIISVDRMMLGDVAKMFHLHEGFLTAEDFLDCWASIHPKAKFDLTVPVWFHQFKMADAEVFGEESK